MIKIIKPGTRKIAECETCGCRFSYDFEDVDGNQHDGFWVTCPQCGHECSYTNNTITTRLDDDSTNFHTVIGY